MTKRKPRILIVGEFSELMTGFSTYYHYLLPRLYATGKYEIAQLAVYARKDHPQIDSVPWKVYPNEPDPGNEEQSRIYHSDPINQFGKWRFEETCLDFAPDWIVSLADNWMCDWILQSPYRDKFKTIFMPTCDGTPQRPEWLANYQQSDVVLAYSFFGKYTMERESNGKIKVFDVASPGSDTEIFCPMDKKKCRSEFGLKPDNFIVGSVMRNQPRKLFPDLMRMFNKYLDLCRKNGHNELANKSYLYIHSSSPDVGWNFSEEIRRHKLSNKVLFTNICQNCGVCYATFWKGDHSHCHRCGQFSVTLPTTQIGLNRNGMARLHNIFDIYVQYSISEGYGMPIADSKACGVPIMAVEHSAMAEQAHSQGGIPIPCRALVQESIQNTNQMRAMPDNDIAAQKLFEFAISSEENKKKLGAEARDLMVKNYNYNNIASIWERAIDSLPILENSPWTQPAQFIKPDLNFPPNLTNEQFVEMCYTKILGKPAEMLTQQAQKAINALNLGYETIIHGYGKMERKPVDRNIVANFMLHRVNILNQAEHIRVQRLLPKNKSTINWVQV